MAHYRLYRLDAAGRIAGPGFDTECACDDDAREAARQMLCGQGRVEVWQGARHVGVVLASEPEAETMA